MALASSSPFLRYRGVGGIRKALRCQLDGVSRLRRLQEPCQSVKLRFTHRKSLNCYAEMEKKTETVREETNANMTTDISSNGAPTSDILDTKSKKNKPCPPNEYPTEADKDEVSFFPVRDPGGFPSADIEKAKSVQNEEEEDEKEYDPLRDGILRYLGYANELGEAFAAWLPPGGVPLSYAVAIGYVLVDTGDKGNKAANEADKELNSISDLNPLVAKKKLTALLAGERAIDTVVWQLLASVIIPGYTIHTVVAFVHFLLLSGLHLNDPTLLAPAISDALNTVATTVHTSKDTVAELVDKSVPTFCGLAAIPFIVHPIDTSVHALLNVTMRPALRKFLCNSGQGNLAGLAICDEECIVNDFPILDESNNFIEALSKSFEEE